MSAVAGGVASKLGGGKFSNGAISAAFVYMFNHNANKLELKFGGGVKVEPLAALPNGKNINKFLAVTIDTNGELNVGLKAGNKGSVSYDVINNTISGEINGRSFSMTNIEISTPTPVGVGVGVGDYGLKASVHAGPVQIYGTVSVKTNPGFWDFINDIGSLECRLGGAC